MNSCVFGAIAMSSGSGHSIASATPRRASGSKRATIPAHLPSPTAAAASSQAAICASRVTSGQGWCECAQKCSRVPSAPRKRL